VLHRSTSQGESAGVPYRGQDRRAIIRSDIDPTGRPFFIAGFGLVLLTAVMLVVSSDQDAGLASVAAGFELSAGALGIVASTLGIVRWRLAGDARALWVGTAVGVYATFSIALAQVLPEVMGEGQRHLVFWVRPASLLVSLALFAFALRAPEVDARLRPARTFGIAVTAFVVTGMAIVVGALLFPEAAAFDNTAYFSIGLTLAWAGFATAYVLRGIREHQVIFAWYGLTMFGLTLAELIRAMVSDDPSQVLGSAIIRCIALLYAVVGVTRALQTMFASQSERLLQSTAASLSSSASLRAAQQRQEEMAHEARNALTAIEGATQTLERFREDLDDETRRTLALAVSDEIGRLQRLVSSSSQTNHPVSFRVADIIGPQVDLARMQGSRITTSAPTDLTAFGRPTEFAEVLQNLLVNARVHGRDPIAVVATRRGGHIIVRVEDCGAGVRPEERHRIFERGARDSDAPGSGLGLYLSRDLMKNLNGNIWVEDRDGGGAAFVLAIPSGSTEPSDSFTDSGRLTPIKRRSNGGKAVNGHGPGPARGAQHADVRARARARKHQKPID
jgi:signal transduction histidine kinase